MNNISKSITKIIERINAVKSLDEIKSEEHYNVAHLEYLKKLIKLSQIKDFDEFNISEE